MINSSLHYDILDILKKKKNSETPLKERVDIVGVVQYKSTRS